jgi:hypothetical protein
MCSAHPNFMNLNQITTASDMTPATTTTSARPAAARRSVFSPFAGAARRGEML